MAEQFDVVVGGSGMGGLAAASLLACRGFKTLLLERRHAVGGYMCDFQRGHYRFDGPTSFVGAVGEDGELGRLLKKIGANDRAAFVPVTNRFRMVLPDREFDTRDRPYLDALAAAFPNQRRKIERFWRILDGIGRDIDRFENLKGWMRLLMPFCCPRLFRHGRATVGNLIHRELSEAGPRALLANLPATAPPSEVSLLFAATVLSKGQRGGLYYPVGGMAGLARLIAEAAKQHGATVRTGAALVAVEHDGRRVRAVRTSSGERIETKAVVADFNPCDVMAMLEGPQTRRIRAARERTSRFRYSASAFIVYMGLKEDGDWSKECFFTGIFETLDMESLYRTIARGEIPEQSVVDVILPCALGRASGNAGPPIGKIITVMPYGPFAQWREREGEDSYQRRKNELADRLIERAYHAMPSLRNAITFREAASPLTLEDWTGNRCGAIYGLEPTVDQFGPTRWPNAAVLKSLYFCGHYSRPSHGIVGTCFSGRFAAERVAADLGAPTSL